MATWPSGLPVYPDDGSFDETLENTVINKPDVGPVKTRARSTVARKIISATYKMTTGQLTTLFNFYMGSLTGGSSTFLWPHPRLASLVTVALTGAPRYSSVEYDWYSVQLDLFSSESHELTMSVGDVGLADRIAYTADIGVLVNGQIDVQFVSNSLKVSVLTVDGATPTPSNPVYCNLGTRVAVITSELSMSKSSGTLNTGDGYWTTSWLHLARGPVSGYEVDLFTYIGWHGTSNSPMLLVSRESYHTTNMFEDEAAGHGALWSLATGAGESAPRQSGDPVAVCGRFNAILTTPNIWSAPNTMCIIQQPIKKTRMLTWNPELYVKYGGSVSLVSINCLHYQYEDTYMNMVASIFVDYTAPSTVANYIEITTPLSAQTQTMFGIRKAGIFGYGGISDPTVRVDYEAVYTHSLTNKIRMYHTDRATLTTGDIYMSIHYREYMPGTNVGYEDF